MGKFCVENIIHQLHKRVISTQHSFTPTLATFPLHLLISTLEANKPLLALNIKIRTPFQRTLYNIFGLSPPDMKLPVE